MCSIFSVITRSNFSNEFKSFAPQILKHSINRWPDHSDYLFINDNIFLWSNRLTIIGDKTGNMPLKSLMWDFWICFNGEIYNYIELRDFLKNKWIKFYSNTDTEVVLNSYIYWGEKFVSKLNGIFAFVILDKKQNKIISARDRFGSKPLYYYSSSDFIWFCSDFISLKTLIPIQELSIDKEGLSANLVCRFIPGNKTIFKNISKLEPAEILTFNISDLKINKEFYWKAYINLKDFSQKEFDKKLTKALIMTSIADVEPSILLSGWLDSSAIVSKLSKYKEWKISTYSCSFSESISYNEIVDWSKITNGSPDESEKALKVSKEFKTNHQHIVISSKINMELFWDMQKALWEPIMVTNALGLYLFGKELKGRTRFALSWTWSDELLWWYEELYFNNISSSRKILTNKELLSSFSDFDNGDKNPLDFLRKDLQDTSYLKNFTEKKMKCFLNNNMSWEYLNQLSLFEISFALPNWELDMADRLFMDFSIELRPSFLENDFLDYCLTIPSQNKIQKSPLRISMKDSLPFDILNQRKIPSLSTPIDFLKSTCFHSLIKDLKETPLNIWDKWKLNKYLKEPYDKLSFDVLYRLIYLQSWLKKYYYTDYKFIKVTIK